MMAKRRDWWSVELVVLEREIKRLQAILKDEDRWPRDGILPTSRRLYALKAIWAARKNQKPLFPLDKRKD